MRRVSISVASAVLITALTALYQRPSGEVVQIATECAGPATCFASRLAAGFPFPYIFDVPSVSVAHQLGPEDHFRALPFVTDVWFYLVLVLLSPVALRQLQLNRRS